jgi:hypothetical protein
MPKDDPSREPPTQADLRKQRLAKALRANLRRRKESHDSRHDRTADGEEAGAGTAPKGDHT